MSSLRWCILGIGNIARSMAADLALVPGATRLAVGSRRFDTAQSFADQWGFARAYGSYEALLADPEVDAVYIATPNARHTSDILASLSAGKHVLCEKPMTLSPEDSAMCFEAAEKAGLFLMEAVWTAFFPAMQKAVALVRDGEIGVPRHLTAAFVAPRDKKSHPNLFDPALGGGARNDLGIYPIAAALLLAGPVERAQAHMVTGATGVDEMAAFTLTHDNGALSVLSCGFRAEMPIALCCVGTKGTLRIDQDFHRPRRVLLQKQDAEQVFDLPYLGLGYAHEAIAFQAAVAGTDRDVAWSRNATLSSARLLRM
jgi:predicted dehydrogenase